MIHKPNTDKVSVKNIIYSIMSVTDPEHLRIIYVGKKDKEFDFLNDSPFDYVLPVDTSDNIKTIKYLEDESKRRIALFKKYRVNNLTEYNKLLEEGKPILPGIIAVTDNFSDIALNDSVKYFGQLPQSKDMGLVAHDLTVSGNSATSLLPHYTWLHLGG